MKNFIIQRFYRVGYATNGIYLFIRDETNAKLHVLASIITIIIAAVLGCTAIEWCIIILCIASIFCAECLNTAIEEIMDYVQPEHHPAVKIIKDLSAGAVMLLGLGSLVIGLIIFIPYLI